MPVKPATPATPAPAATLVLLRAGAGGVEVLLIRRHQQSRFAGGDFVFPGGKVEPDETAEDGAIRETFEEVGVLLAAGPDGGPFRLDGERWRAWRRACQEDRRAFREMLRAEGLRPATDRLVYFAHWITPEERPLRFDTRFFAAEMPAGQEAVADAREITAVRWLPPESAPGAAARGELSLRLPTRRNVALFEGAASVAEALARVRGRPVATIRPRLLVENGEPKVLLPGDPGWW